MVLEGLRSKVALDVDVKCPTTIVLPLNQCSDQLLVLESDGVRLNNEFKPMSSVEDVFQKNCIDNDYGYDTSVDCLLDCLKVVLLELRAYEGRRLATPLKKDDKTIRAVSRGAFDSTEMVTSLESVFNRRFDLSVDVFRNLDGVRSHNAPDLTVVTSISKLMWRMTSDFYVLFRGVLEKNFGDSLIPIPETIPIEILQKPTTGCEVGSDSKYATLSFRLLLDEVELDCQVPLVGYQPSPQTLFGKPFTPFAVMQLQSARVSFDVFIDGQSELDLVCESTHLLDTRKVQLGSGTKNLFNTILQPRDSSTKKFPLMSEAHIMMRKDEVPVVTLVLMHSRVLLLYDWLNDAKNFILLSTDFVPKCGGISANLEIQNMAIGWCCMQDEKRTLNQCSNEFSIAVSMAMNEAATPASEPPRGLPSLAVRRHSMEGCRFTVMMRGRIECTVQVDISGMIGRLSYKDMQVLRTTAEGYIKNFYENSTKTMIPVIGTPPPPKSMEIGRVMLKTERADLWLLDDFQGSSIPLLRVSLSNLSMDRQSEDRLVSSFALSADYFNQRVFGWEPMIEKWSVLRFLVAKKDNTQNVDLVAESRSTLDINITEQLMQQAMQFSSRWPAIRASFERDDFRNSFSRSRSDHLPYLFKNETGCEVMFSTAVEDIQLARKQQRKTTGPRVTRKATVRWITVPKDKEHTFEFPARLLLYSHSEREPPRQLIVKVNGWDEISPVHVDACGTYFRLVKPVKKNLQMARVVIRVTMEKDGKKVVSAEITWSNVRVAGETLNRTEYLESSKSYNYWICTSVRREQYPDHEGLPGHSIYVVAPLTVQNLLPIDVEIHILDHVLPVAAGKQLLITTVDITKTLAIRVITDRLRTVQECYISKSGIGEGQLVSLRLRDSNGRPLDMYGNVRLGVGGSISLSLWVPYWIVNKSGIPLILKQEAADSEAAGQMAEHEQAKDRHPLMFSFADDGCPKQCVVRVGHGLAKEPNYRPRYSHKFALTPGVQALKLSVVHESLPTLYYNIGVEVRAGTGRYKDTQVVLLTSRYVISNQSSFTLSVCHHDLIDRLSEHVHIASQCSLVWNENYEDCRQLCVRRSDVRHWSCPFRIDRIGSFHITMRDADETPRFVRVEVILNSAVFCVTFTDAEYYPPPIRIENQSDVPVLYQQQSEGPIGQHLRTICKARSHIDYAWDDLYGSRRIVLQVMFVHSLYKFL
ncbi:hypothetical protein ANCCAN_23890 [Ancylostoma caninum]|uniref:Vacuolar protein sorting-associated protein 13 VPS13 adaptor binding domain-containing protein n=1 Tax=Ancylostoma caninum TaxID=29170 RepID=A0A368FDS9_ANCCA|nr:hypothetical protein ANCCAN_23890 [Ancylostoma caninum]